MKGIGSCERTAVARGRPAKRFPLLAVSLLLTGSRMLAQPAPDLLPAVPDLDAIKQVVAPATVDVPRVNEILLLARHGKDKAAIASYEKLPLALPRPPELELAMAAVYRRAGRIADAAAAFRRYLQENAGSEEVHADFVGLLIATGTPAQAVEAAERALQHHPGSAAILMAKAEAQKLLEDFEGAAATIDRARKLHPDHPLLGRAAAGVLIAVARRSQPGTALRLLEEAAALGGDPSDLAAEQTVALERAGRPAEAIARYETLEPDAFRPRETAKAASRAYRALQAPDKAAAILEALVEADASDMVSARALVQALNEAGRHEQAARKADALMARAGPDVQLLLDKAVARQGLGDARGALRTYERVLELRPEHRQASGAAAALLAELAVAAPADEAAGLLGRAVDLSDRAPDMVAAYARALAEAGRHASAISAFESLPPAYENAIETLMALAGSYRHERKFNEAGALYGLVLKRSPGDGTALAELTRTLTESGNPIRAARIMEGALTRNPGSVELLFAKAELENETQGPAAALTTLDRLLAVSPGDARALNLKLSALARLGCLSLAEELAREHAPVLEDEALAELRALREQAPASAAAWQDAAARATVTNDPVVLGYPAMVREGDGDSGVTPRELVRHLEHLRAIGYSFLGVADALQNRRKGARHALLTFDGGCSVFRSEVAPILVQYGCPAVLLVGGEELGQPRGEDAQDLWNDIRTLISANGFALGYRDESLLSPITATPLRDRGPAITTRAWLAESKTYETADAYTERVQRVLGAAADLLTQQAGRDPKVLVWPDGEYNATALEAAYAAGFTLQFSDPHAGAVHAASLPQRLRVAHGSTADFSRRLAEFVFGRAWPAQPLRTTRLRLDDVYDSNATRASRHLDAAVARYRAMGVNTVYVQAFSDPEQDGSIRAFYFPNRRFPVRADLLGSAVARLRQAGIAAYAWMPTATVHYDPKPDTQPIDVVLTQQRFTLGTYPSETLCKRLSPFNDNVQSLMQSLYEDMAAHAAVDGVLFHDDAFMTGREDFGPAGLAVFRAVFGEEADPDAMTEDQVERWTRIKTRQINALIKLLTDVVRRYRPNARTARAVFPPCVGQRGPVTSLAQDYALALRQHDHVLVQAYPELQGAFSPHDWLRELVHDAADTDGGLNGTIFEIQAYDWGGAHWISAYRLKGRMRRVLSWGGRHIGYYPDSFIENEPALSRMSDVMRAD